MEEQSEPEVFIAEYETSSVDPPGDAGNVIVVAKRESLEELPNPAAMSLKTQHYRRLQPKLRPIQNGTVFRRNEACPCGSGNKFKKCCLRRAHG